MVGAGVTQEVAALLRLKMCPGLGDRRISALVNEHGSGKAALRAVRSQGRLFEPEESIPSTDAWRTRGVQAVPMTSPDYPPVLRNLTDPPPLLFLKGRPALLRGPAVAIVGARRCTSYGMEQARRVASALAGAGFTPVVVPVLVREEAVFGTGFFPSGREQVYAVGPSVDDESPITEDGDRGAKGLRENGILEVVGAERANDRDRSRAIARALHRAGRMSRAGRTGRAGATGVSISFASEDDAFLLPDLEALLGSRLDCTHPPPELLR